MSWSFSGGFLDFANKEIIDASFAPISVYFLPVWARAGAIESEIGALIG
jgi:hypothetical protein